MHTQVSELDQLLTKRQLEVLRLVAAGKSNKEVAVELRVAEDTVKGHISELMQRLDVDNRVHLVLIGNYGFSEQKIFCLDIKNEISEKLTKRQLEVLKQVATGNTNKEIAEELRLSEDTVKGHVRNIMQHLNANNRAHLVNIAIDPNQKTLKIIEKKAQQELDRLGEQKKEIQKEIDELYARKEALSSIVENERSFVFSQKNHNSISIDNLLSRREMEVLVLLANGYNRQQISKVLAISQSTVATHIANIYKKLGINSVAEATIYAMKSELIS